MRLKANASFLLLLLALCLLSGGAEAGWKFWKKKDKDTTVEPELSTTEATPSPTPATTGSRGAATPPTASRPSGSPASAGSAIIGAANPGLAIGVGASGQEIRNNARPQRPNPGTEVGLDINAPRPGRPGTGGTSGQGYRDWAADLTGAGEPGRQPPRLPSQGPALSGPGLPAPSRPTSFPGSPSQPGIAPGTRPPTSVPASGPVQPSTHSSTAAPRPTLAPFNTPAHPQPSTPAARPTAAPVNLPSQPQSLGPRPSSPGNPAAPLPNPDFPPLGSRGTQAGQNQPSNQPGGNVVSSLNVGPLRPGSPTTPAPRPGSPNDPGRSWADIAATGNSRPNSPTPSPRQPAYPPNQPTPGSTQLSSNRPSAGAIAAGGALAGAAGAAAVGAATTSGKQYSSNPTYSKGTSITDEDLEKLGEALFIKDTTNANSFITLNLQKQTSSSSPKDEAPQPLFTVQPSAYQIPTINRVRAIFDNYQLDTHTNEYISPAQRQEESLLVDTFLSTSVMSAAMRFLADKGHVRKDYYEYKDTLRRLWFNLFSRGQGKIGSTGFEHVFMAELKPGTPNPEVLGLHNWLYFSAEEAKRNVDYLGYIKKVDLGNKASILKLHARFNGHDKPVTTIFVGTSPELEMALYTVCFFARPDANCPVSLGGTKFNIITHKFKYRGNDLVGTAYPDI